MKRTSLPRRTFRTGAPDPRECARQKRGRPGKVGISLLSGLIYVVCLMALCRAASSLDNLEPVPRPPRLSPDYAGIVIPPNIAPLNFAIEEPEVARHRVRVLPVHGRPLEVTGNSASVELPMAGWRAMLESNRGEPLVFEVEVRGSAGDWRRFAPVTNLVSADPVDGYLVYRLLRPVYNIYGAMGIYQRDLGSFTETPILENRAIEDGCLNCHTFLAHRAEPMALHIRHRQSGNPMLLIQSNAVTRVDQTSGYLSWHPSGRLLAFAVNRFALLFHTTGETRDLYDGASDLGIHRLDSNQVVMPPAISKPDRLENWPAWDPAGRYLYFCSAPKLRIERHKQIRYDLMRVAYDLEQDSWGEPETLVSARDTMASAAQPRISPDGRWLLFCLAPYGNFPAYHAGSDLHLMDLETRSMRRLEINSDQSDSWHCWSSNSRWIVFSSKRRDQLFTRPYFSHVDQQGHCSKPFLLPQRDPRFYDAFVKTYNLPEFVREPVTVTPDDLARGVLNPRAILKPQSASTPGQAVPVEHEAEEGRTSGR